MSYLPSISIVTPSFNRAWLVVEAIESAGLQDYPYVEHIIVDGGSTDGTLETLARYPELRVYSEPDDGVYDALNKGIDLARGQVIGFLNTDDLYEPDIFGTVAKEFADNPEIDAVVGGASIFRSNAHGMREILATFPCVPQNELLARSTQGVPVFNAWFFSRRLFDKLGFFDCRFLYVADRDLLIRMAFQNISYASLEKPLYHYRMHSGSYTLSGQDSGEAGYMFENRALAEKYLRLKGLSPEAFSCFRTWHSQVAVEQILTAWRRRALRRVARYMLIGLRHDPLGWPGIFLAKFIERLNVLIHGSAGLTAIGEGR